MQRAVRKPPGADETFRWKAVRAVCGQAMLEFLIAALVGIVLILGILQITLLYNARSMVKLAAFNAARAAIVTRATGRARSRAADDPVTVVEMLEGARRAAFLTLLPVIPAIQGRLDPNASPPSADTFENMAETDATDSAMAAALNSVFSPGGKRGDVALYELRGETIDDDRNHVPCLDVRFVDPTANLSGANAAATQAAIDAATINSWPSIRFDDPKRSSEENIIKVLVTWRYPLVIPFVNRIITAVARPKLYAAALSASGSSATVADMQKGLDDPDKMRNMIPVWATGYAFTQVGTGAMGIGGLGGPIAGAFSGITLRNPPPAQGSQVDGGNTVQDAAFEGNGEVVFTNPSDNNSIKQSIGEFLVFRVPIRATFIMRMQWDRNG